MLRLLAVHIAADLLPEKSRNAEEVTLRGVKLFAQVLTGTDEYNIHNSFVKKLFMRDLQQKKRTDKQLQVHNQ
jgi:hypothetical protein